MEDKKCTKCKKSFPNTLDYFYFDKHLNKLCGRCKKCKSNQSVKTTKNNYLKYKDRLIKECTIKQKQHVDSISDKYAARVFTLNSKVLTISDVINNFDILEVTRLHIKLNRLLNVKNRTV